MEGVQDWLSFYWKSPQTAAAGLKPEHDIFIQQMKLKNTLRQLMGDEPVTHIDTE
ncbi:MAG: inositol-3-phosphate synthase [Acidimicrobiales bacterium]